MKVSGKEGMNETMTRRDEEGLHEGRVEREIEESKTSVDPRRGEANASWEENESLTFFDDNEIEHFRSRWEDIQIRFVDDPQETVKKANQLVDDTINSIADTFAQQQAHLEKQWNSGDQVTTEDLRVALKHYRYFFNRLLDM